MENQQPTASNLPPLDPSFAKEKEKQGIWTWRYDKDKDVALLDVKEIIGGIETGNVHTYEFSALNLETERIAFDKRMLDFDTRILEMKQQQETDRRTFNAQYKDITEAVERTLKEAKKPKK